MKTNAIKMKSIALGLIVAGGLLMQACAPKSAPQRSCNFVMTSDNQRVSWGQAAPAVLYVDASVATEFYPSIQAAIEKWNKSVGHEVLKLGGWTNQYATERQDGINVIYFSSQWSQDKDSKEKQAITTIYWAGDRIFESDIRVNVQNFSYTTGTSILPNKVNFESLMGHELGHVLGLEHSEVGGSVMAKRLENGTLRLDPAPVDIDNLKCEYQ